MQLFSRFQWITLVTLSTAVFVFLMWWIYGFSGSSMATAPVWSTFLPEANALFNTLCAICLVFGFKAILSKNISRHRRFMASALLFSTLFLVSYLLHHYFNGDTLYAGPEGLRLFYYAILISHIVLTIVVLPLILGTVFLALTGRFPQHKRIARVTLPIWLYISVTGVMIYGFHLL